MNLNRTQMTTKSNLTNGWVKMPRSILSLPGYFAGPFDAVRCWLDLQLQAEWHDERQVTIRNKQMRLTRGQVAVSEAKLAERWSLPRCKVRRTLATLEEQGLISVQRISRFQTVITVAADADRAEPTSPSVPTLSSAPTPPSEPVTEQPANRTTEPQSAPVSAPTNETMADDERYFSEFFSESRQISREQIRRRFRLSEDELAERVRGIVEEWLLTDTRHRDYNDWARHIVSLLQIRLNSAATPSKNRYAVTNNNNQNPFTNPTPEAYGYNSETVDTTDTQKLLQLINESGAGSLNAFHIPAGTTMQQLVAVANASAAKRHGGDRYTTKAERDAEFAVYVQKQLAKARGQAFGADFEPPA